MTSTLHVPRRAQRSPAPVRLLGLGTATPTHLPQTTAADLAVPLCCDTEQHRDFLHRVFAHSGVTSRSSVLADVNDSTRLREFYRPRHTPADRGPTTAERMKLYEQYAPVLAEESASAALRAAELDPWAITHLVPVTCTGFFSPGLDVQLINRLNLSPRIQRVQAGFMGCHGAFNGLIAASAIAAADPTARVLVTCVELCTLHLAYGFHPQRVVANALFADGSASVIVGSPGISPSGSPELLARSTMLIPDTADAMTWRIGDHGFEMTLSPAIPDLVRHYVPGWIRDFLREQHLTTDEIAHYAIHPGGPKVLTATSDALGFPRELLAPSCRILSDHGNMSSATILFVLQDLLNSAATGRCLALGFGPGLTAEAMLLHL